MEFLENRRSWEKQKPPENRQKSGLFWASPFTMHLVCTLSRIMKKTRRAPDYSSNLCPPKIWSIWLFEGRSWACFLFFFLYKRPKNTPKKSDRSYFRRAQIRWVIWRLFKNAKVTPTPHIQGENMNKNLDNIWPQMLQNKANSTVLPPHFVHIFTFYVGVGVSSRFPRIIRNLPKTSLINSGIWFIKLRILVRIHPRQV